MNNAQLVIDEVKKAVKGKDDCIIKAFAAFLAGGHILLEDVPGVGKTTLAVAFSRAMALVNHRVQFTPDVLLIYLAFLCIRSRPESLCTARVP